MKTRILLFLIGFSSWTSMVSAQEINYKVYSLFVVNIAKFSNWPAETTSFSIVVLGNSDIYEQLQLYAPRGLNGKTVTVTKVKSIEEVGAPDMVYLPSTMIKHLPGLIAHTSTNPTMIVSEQQGSYKKGADVSFFITGENSLRLDINVTNLDKRGIKVAKNLLGMAHDKI